MKGKLKSRTPSNARVLIITETGMAFEAKMKQFQVKNWQNMAAVTIFQTFAAIKLTGLKVFNLFCRSLAQSSFLKVTLKNLHC